jgi:uncharacterized damage-inducible protein DinB
MRAVDLLLLAFDHAFEHRWESLAAALDGVGPEEAGWQSPAYADAEPEAGWPLPGTIHWHVAHLAHCKRHYTELVLQRERAGRPPAPSFRANPTFDESLAELKAAHARQRAALAALTDAELEMRLGNGDVLAEFVSACTRHDAWHAAQIALARRLHRTRR